MNSQIPASAVRYWSKILADRCFETKQAARNEVFHICEKHSRQSWSTPEGQVTAARNREFSKSMPLYEEDGLWKVGQPIQEYLSNMSSDFSDGTNGEPSGYPPSAGDGDTAVGIPDYKYLERKKRRHDKLRALMQRRDPDEISTNPVDRAIRAGIKEAEGKLLFHITHADRLPLIKKEGIGLLRPTNWSHGPGGERYGTGEIYAFENFNDAVKWAAKMDWEFNNKFGSGKIAIITFKDTGGWEADTNDPISQFGAKGRWLKRMNSVKPADLVEITPLTIELVKQQTNLFEDQHEPDEIE